jgi:hypothetical protein
MVIIDSDGQHDPDEIPAYRKVGMRILDITTNFLGGLSLTDTQSGFRAFSGQVKGVSEGTRG